MPKTFDRNIPFNDLPDLPPKADLETKAILKLCIEANRLLGELKGYCQTLPNPNLLLNTIVLQESKASNAIENIITTQDELYQATLRPVDQIKNPSAKEVIQYRQAIYWGMSHLEATGLITTNFLVAIMQRLRGSDENIRKNPRTKLANPTTRDIVYTPPEGEDLIRTKLASLEQFMNDETLSGLDPLIKMALIHYQFEAIHPFSDGNGRTGRILNVLYLVQQKLLSLPVLYLSRYVIQNKSDYYRLLRLVTEEQKWTEWIEFMVKGIGETAQITLERISSILQLKEQTSSTIRNVLKSSYSKELVDLLFSHPYIKVSIIENAGLAKRQTAAQYLKKLEEAGVLRSVKLGRDVYYINDALMDILSK